MYRRPAAQGPLHGVGAGVYTGGRPPRDCLYDEVYGLFFEGDPRVPLHGTPGVDEF